MDFSRELQLLRQQKMAAIKECDFKKARDINGQIIRLKQENQENTTTNTRRISELSYESEKENVRLEAARVHSESADKIFQLKMKYQKQLAVNKTRHAEQIQFLAEQHAKDIELCALRTVPESELLKMKAQTEAKASNFDFADMYFEESKQIKQTTFQQRQAEINSQYEAALVKLQEQHEEEDELCRRNYRAAIDEIRRKHDLKGIVLQKRLGFRAVTLNLPVEDENILEPLVVEDELDIDNELPMPARSLSRGAATPSPPRKSSTVPLRKREQKSSGDEDK